jgi:hypothetical protein
MGSSILRLKLTLVALAQVIAEPRVPYGMSIHSEGEQEMRLGDREPAAASANEPGTDTSSTLLPMLLGGLLLIVVGGLFVMMSV